MNARLRPDGRGGLLAEAARSCPSVAIPRDHIPFVVGFLLPRLSTEAIAVHLDAFSGQARDRLRRALVTLISALVDSGVLIAADRINVSSHGHYADPLLHLGTLWDQMRVSAYRSVLERCAPGRVLAEIGSGHGVMTCFAARAGAKRVYAIEEASIIETARAVVSCNGLADRVVFIEGNSLDVDLPERVDVVYSDLMGADPLGGGMVIAHADAAMRFLRAGGVMVPQSVTVSSVGVESARVRSETDRAAAWLRRAQKLNADLGLDVSALVEASRARFEAAYREYWYKAFVSASGDADTSSYGDRVITAEAVVANFDLADPGAQVPVTVPIHLQATAHGRQNAMATYCTVSLDDWTTLTTSPFATVRPSSWGGQFVTAVPPLDVDIGDTIPMLVEIMPASTPACRYARAESDGREPASENLFGATDPDRHHS
jgi:precorrin-6B methylase 2